MSLINKKLLVVEDNEYDAEMILAALAEHNLDQKADVVKDGEEALDYLYQRGKYTSRESGNPGFILLDIKLPKLNGLDVLTRIKTEQALTCIPIIMLTSSREKQDINECYKRGANAYVVKPVNYQEFIDTVKQLCAFWALLNEPLVA